MPRSASVDGFTLAYDHSGSGPAVVLLHGWPGDRGDHRALVPLLAGEFETQLRCARPRPTSLSS